MQPEADNPYQFATAGDHRLAYRRSGKGEAFFLLHGVASYSFLWRPVVAGLAGQYDMIAPDLPTL